jgi:hypothetical protein
MGVLKQTVMGVRNMIQPQVINIALFLVLPLFAIVMVYWCAKSYVVGESRPKSRARYTGPPPDGKGTLPLFYANDVPYSVEPSGVRGVYGTFPVRGRRERKKTETH